MAAAIAAKETIGDMRNNLMKLTRELKRMKMSVDINLQGLSLGCPSAFLPILHASLMLYSLPLANWLTRQGYELYAKSDLRFIEGLYKVLRDIFHYRPRLSKEQFLSVGFAEHKIIFTTHILLLSQAKHHQLTGKKEAKKSSKKRRSRAGSAHSAVPIDHSSVVVRERESSSLAPPTNAGSSDMPYPYSIREESGALEPTTLRFMYTPPTSPHPSRDLELTPHPSHQPSQVSHVITSPAKHPQNADLTTTPQSTAHSSAGATIPIQTRATTSPLLAITRTSSPSSCSSVVGSSTAESDGEIENGGDSEPTVVVPVHEERESEQLPALSNISSRMDGIMRLMESMSARVDLMETHMKMVESLQASTSHSPTARDQSTCTEFRDTSTLLASGHDTGTHCHSPPLHTHHTTHTSLTTTTSESSPPKFRIASAAHTPSHYKDLLSKPHPPHQTTPYSLSIHQSTPSTPEEARRLIESLRSRAKKTRDFLQQVNSNSDYKS